MTTLYTNARMNGILIADREQLTMPLDIMSKPTLHVGNTIDSAIPVLTAEFTQPQLMPKAHVLAVLDEQAHKASNRAMRQHLDEMMASISRAKSTHYWVA